jgi:hypothetical protein
MEPRDIVTEFKTRGTFDTRPQSIAKPIGAAIVALALLWAIGSADMATRRADDYRAQIAQTQERAEAAEERAQIAEHKAQRLTRKLARAQSVAADDLLQARQELTRLAALADRLPTCAEDEPYLRGVGDFEHGYWSGYECVHIDDI